MQIHIARESSTLGVFSTDEVIRGLQNGKFLMTDLAWREGMSTWVILAQWAEFRGAIPAAPLDVHPQGNLIPVTVPWEKEKSFTAYFSTIKGALFNPIATFASGEYKFKSYILFAYITALLFAPLSIFGQLHSDALNRNLIEIIKDLDIPSLKPAIDSLANQPVVSSSYAWISVICYSVVYPLIIGLFGFFLWIGLKILRQNSTIESACVATLVGGSVVNLLSALILLTVEYKLYFSLVLLSIIPSIIISCRISGAILKVSALRVFTAWFIVGLVGNCACCCLITILGAFLKGLS